MEPVYEVHGLCKYYGKKAALDGVDFTVEPGKLVGLLGPNGSGSIVFHFDESESFGSTGFTVHNNFN